MSTLATKVGSCVSGDSLILRREEFEAADFSARSFRHFTIVESRFVRCRFDGATIRQACFGAGVSQSEYLECTFDGARIWAPAPGNARFVGCSFRSASISDFFGLATEFVDCVFTGAIRKAVFYASAPEGPQKFGRQRNEFHGNDFSGADLVDVAFRGGIDLREQRLPIGSQYIFIDDACRAIALAKSAGLVLSDLDLRRRVLAVLSILDRTVAGGQEQLLLRLDGLGNEYREAMAWLFSFVRTAADPRVG